MHKTLFKGIIVQDVLQGKGQTDSSNYILLQTQNLLCIKSADKVINTRKKLTSETD